MTWPSLHARDKSSSEKRPKGTNRLLFLNVHSSRGWEIGGELVFRWTHLANFNFDCVNLNLSLFICSFTFQSLFVDMLWFKFLFDLLRTSSILIFLCLRFITIIWNKGKSKLNCLKFRARKKIAPQELYIPARSLLKQHTQPVMRKICEQLC